MRSALDLEDFLLKVSDQIRNTFGNALLGLYKIGSLAHGGFNPQYSDIDLALISSSTVHPHQIQKILNGSQEIDTRWGTKLSLFWTDPQFSGGRFPILDQIDYLDHRISLYESHLLLPRRPSLLEVQNYLSQHPLDYWKGKTAFFQNAKCLEEIDHKEFLRCLIYPARFLYTWTTGKMTSNDLAVDFLGQLESQVHFPLVEQALHLRNLGGDLRPLFQQNQRLLQHQLQATLEMVGLV